MRRWAVGALLLLVACAVPLRVDQRGPDFDGTRTLRMRGNLVPTPVNGMAALEVNAERRERPGEYFQHALLIEVRGEALRMRQGPSLQLMIGGDTVELVRDSTVTSWLRVDPTVSEQARFPASDSVMLRLASADAAEVAVRAAGWWERRRLSPRRWLLRLRPRQLRRLPLAPPSRVSTRRTGCFRRHFATSWEADRSRSATVT